MHVGVRGDKWREWRGGLGTKRRLCLILKSVISLDCWQRKERRSTLSVDKREG